MRYNITTATCLACMLSLIVLTNTGISRNAPSEKGDHIEFVEIMRLGRGAANEFAWRPDGNVIAVGGVSGVWFYTPDLEDIMYWETGYVSNLYWHPDGSRIITLGVTGITLWNATNGEAEVTVPDSAGLGGWDSQGNLLALQRTDGRIQIWDNSADHPVTTCVQNDETPSAIFNDVSAMAWSPTEELLAIVDGSKIVLCDANTGYVTLSKAVPAIVVDDLAWSPDGTQIAITNGQGGLWTWEVAPDGSFTLLAPDVSAWHVGSPAWSPNGSRLAAAMQTSILIWDSNTNQFLHEFTLTTMEGYGGFGYGEYRSVAWSPDGRRLLTGTVGSMQVIDGATGQEIATNFLHTGSVNAIAWDQYGRIAVAYGDQTYTTYGDNRIRIWDSTTGSLLSVCQGHIGSVNSIAWSPDATLLVSGGGSFFQGDGSVIVWYAMPCEPQERRDTHAVSLHTVAWNPQGTSIAVAFDPVTLLCDDNLLFAECKVLQGVSMQKWSPDGTRLAGEYWGVSDNNVVVYSLETEQLQVFRGHAGPVRSVSWNPAGNELASGAEDTTVRIWNTETGDWLATYEGHRDTISALAWSPDGSKIASVSADHMVRIWDVATGQTSMVVDIENDAVTSVAWSADGNKISIGSLNGILRIYNIIY